jgi:hypothetical protein
LASAVMSSIRIFTFHFFTGSRNAMDGISGTEIITFRARCSNTPVGAIAI